jgi:hypothetical protein
VVTGYPSCLQHRLKPAFTIQFCPDFLSRHRHYNGLLCKARTGECDLTGDAPMLHIRRFLQHQRLRTLLHRRPDCRKPAGVQPEFRTMSSQGRPKSEHVKRLRFLLQHAHRLKISVFKQSTNLDRMVYDCADSRIVYI